MYKNAEKTIKNYVSILVWLTLTAVGFVGCVALIATLGGEEDAFLPFVICLLVCVGIWVSGAFLYAFADLVEQSKLQSELLMDIIEVLNKQVSEEDESKDDKLIEEIKEFKNLLDIGAITEDEYNKKVNELKKHFFECE